jgi:hydrogenase maturation protease
MAASKDGGPQSSKCLLTTLYSPLSIRLDVTLDRVLILGYGNLDRKDDGVAWHILDYLSQRLGRPSPSPDEGFQRSGLSPELLFVLQLTPELAETISEFDRVCFVDAHTGSVPEELNVVEIQSHFQASPFTHHMTPASCMALSEALYQKDPQAILVSVRGYEFGFERSLSPRTAELAGQAAEHIWEWINEPRVNKINLG